MRRLVPSIAIAIALAACGPSSKKPGNNPDAPPGGACTAGEMHCNGTTLQVCGSDGTFMDQQVCANACSDTLGCVVCVPGTGTCNGDVSHACNDTGTGYTDTTCDPVEGSSCDPNSGLCTGPCAPQAIGKSYIGCEYYPTVTGNEVGSGFPFAVAVSNTGVAAAMVTVDGGALGSAMTFTVQPGDVQVQHLPWVPSLKLCDNGTSLAECGATTSGDVMAAKGAYHLRSTQPVTVYQFNPLDYTINGQFSVTNDASLLIPTNAWTGNYVVASSPAWTFVTGDIYPGELAITAARDATHVTITPTAATKGSGSTPAMSPGTPQTITLDAGDVLELATYTGDLTGSVIAADAPVQVVGGHDCTYLPSTVPACDHIEESMFPVETLSNKYVIAAPALPTTGFDNGKVEIIRILGTVDGTTLTYDPPQAGAPTTVDKDKFVEISGNANSFYLTSTHKILVAQYMEGENAGGGMGDPAMALAVATDQYRTNYQFHAPTNYTTNYVQITAPTGDNLMLDGAPLTATFTAIGGSTYGVARAILPNNATGNHSITGPMPFGIQVYGYGQYTSYWYPGGLDLTDIPVN